MYNKAEKKINFDLDAMLNIACKLGYRMRISRKIEGY